MTAGCLSAASAPAGSIKASPRAQPNGNEPHGQTWQRAGFRTSQQRCVCVPSPIPFAGPRFSPRKQDDALQSTEVLPSSTILLGRQLRLVEKTSTKSIHRPSLVGVEQLRGTLLGLQDFDLLTYHIGYGYTAICGESRSTAGWGNSSMPHLV